MQMIFDDLGVGALKKNAFQECDFQAILDHLLFLSKKNRNGPIFNPFWTQNAFLDNLMFLYFSPFLLLCD